ncbi:MAG TPA: bifunctional transaldolase/phosoglucose isomerase [Candidatus Methylomirabilis sp.]|nr:bifunctional transaldolase/phosoglucose isomerase [Candidatus Methylomirabilis sp.]
MNPLKNLGGYHQSIWLDYIRRGLITSGELARLIQEDGLGGVTSNPSIFEKAIAGSTDYAAALDELRRGPDLDAMSLYEHLAIRDIQDAADLLRPVHAATDRRDGYVSLEVSPYLAHDTRRTVEEARRLWKAVARENVMIKVPGTPGGIPAVQQLIGEGINVNVTLLFDQAIYEQVAEAYLTGLETLAAGGGDLKRVASVASFFVSRIDTAVDGLVAARLRTSTSPEEQTLLRSLPGKVAIANAKLAYQRYIEISDRPRWRSLAAKGARTQRLLWASTGTKNPAYRDVMYVEELIGPDTVNTIPPATLDAFRDHGRLRASLEEGLAEARETMARLARAGISLTEVTDRLLLDGVQLFAEAFDKLLAAVETRRKAGATTGGQRLTYRLPGPVAAAVTESLHDWRTQGKLRKLWDRDASLWTGGDEGKWLGWLRIAEDQAANVSRLTAFAEEVKAAGFRHALLLGMGGSSLCPEVFRLTFGRLPGFPELHVLDSTDPAQVQALERKVDLGRTLFIVSSKSGTTLEPNIFKQYFFERVRQVVGGEEAGKRFIAITDPGSKLQAVAEKDGFRHVFLGEPSIGGRYSALSDFGMVPAAVMGLDVRRLLDRAEEMVHACASCVPPEENPGAVLGTILGVLGKSGRDKVTLIASPGIRDLGAWLEQLLAESTGKQGRGLIPVDREQLGPPEAYGSDRLFVYVRLGPAPDPKQDAAVGALEQAGFPVVHIGVVDPYDLGQEFLRWEIATAVAGSILGIHPFDQPDVEASKVATRDLTGAYERTGSLPAETSFFDGDGIRLFADGRNADALNRRAGGDHTLAGYLRAHLGGLQAGDYLGLLAYLEMTDAHESKLQAMRHAIRDSKRVATCLGFGPRFLHSTGQAYKGGPNTGVFLQITCEDAADLPVPGQRYSFGVVKAAQARGDFQVLAERGRRALRVHLGDVETGLRTLGVAVERALA